MLPLGTASVSTAHLDLALYCKRRCYIFAISTACLFTSNALASGGRGLTYVMCPICLIIGAALVDAVRLPYPAWAKLIV